MRSALAGYTNTKNVHASSVGSVGGDYSIANDTYTAANKEPKKPKEPKQKKPQSGDPAEPHRPDWMPEPDHRNNGTQSDHPDGEKLGPEAIQAQTGCSDQEAKDWYSAVRDFSVADYDDIRKYAHDGPPPSHHKNDAENLEQFIAASPKWEDGPLYRGMNVKPEIANSILAEAKKGKLIDQRGPSSWSSKRSVADSFADKDHPDDVSIVFITSGRQNGTSIKNVSRFPLEAEVLMSNDARWQPTDVKEVYPGYWEITCEPVGVP